MPQILLLIIVSYLIGSIPTAYLLGRLIKGIDIRKFGSGNVGATNAFRVLGKGIGILVLVIDVLKGVIPVVFFASENISLIALGIASVCGHNWTIFLKFKGGKGVATTFGVLIGLALKIPGLKVIFGLTLLTWLVVFLITRIVSIASIASSIALPIYMFLYKQPKEIFIMSIILSIFLIWRHKPNIARLLQGKEPSSF